MTIMVNALTIKIALACYTSSRPNEEIGTPWGTVPGQEARKWLYLNGIIDSGDFPTITDKGRSWIERMMSTPMPTQKWVYDDQ